MLGLSLLLMSLVRYNVRQQYDTIQYEIAMTDIKQDLVMFIPPIMQASNERYNAS